MIYLDYNARAPLLVAAQQAMIEALQLEGNPSAVHGFGRAIRKKLEEARAQIAQFIGAKEREVVFTSGASESNTQILKSFKQRGAQIFVSAIEHASVWMDAADATIIPVTMDGIVDIAALEVLLQKAPKGLKAVSVMVANNETGVIQPIADVRVIAKNYDCWVHVDATQAVGRIPISFKEWEVDYLTFSSHKLGGPVGVGVTVVREGWPLEALIVGGGQEQNRRAGTQNVAAIRGFAAAVQEMQKFDWQPVAALRDYLEHHLKVSVPSMQVVGEKVARLPNTSCLHMPGVDSSTQVMAFDLAGIAISAGSACSSGKVKPSRVLQAMGLGEEVSRQTIRVSLCPHNTSQEIEQFIATWIKVYSSAENKLKVNK
jgi:cysteine desulfurase